MAAASLAEALAEAARLLAAAGVPSPRVDAELLAAHVLGESAGRVRVLALTGAPEPEGLAELVSERARRVPLQHITGKAYFRHLELAVGPGVFVPRPETETVAQHAIDAARRVAGAKVVDLGTGSGAIAGSVADEVPGADVYAVELSGLAYAWAERNLQPLGVTLVRGDLRTALSEHEGTFDVVVSNPPYIPPDAVPVDPEVAEHDPELALYGGGVDGMELPRATADSAARLLKPGGYFIMEHAEVQAAAVSKLLAAAGCWNDIATVSDLTGRERATAAIRR
ncbi:N5-glutamine S-adenosyl-L-methionine-dependent methyltransferase [Arthrobacter crystallopoietes BAB-32]|uniref:Release factor glutamine methyltransferase n=1 Tax=Arthrobacter crystallopoietes BAB-32 TaxID=1246476 RepID=N1V010_9MICC|nr:peptide chain release factor N(5)-glutamine methyltransferase [Arthrobacter crystallopoietes]EMY34645.1 N5-glutamine S-adenosyl-L-methionine-dependent methyltransferase [Arthrobacter crystallopoietes BAB-32]